MACVKLTIRGNDVTTIEKTKVRLQQGKLLAGEVFGNDGGHPALIAATVQSLAVDELAETIKNEARELALKIGEAAAVASAR